MCLIIQRKPNFEIPFEKFKSAVINNPDGYGLSYPDNGKLITLRTPEEPDPEKLYRMVNEELIEKELMLHLRFTTVGETILRNAHPFPILEKDTDGVDLRMAHNGTLGKYRPKGQSTESDTRLFVKTFVRPLFKRLVKGMEPEELMTDGFVKALLEDQLTTSSVLTFLDGNGNSLICNETGNGGKQEDQWYYSNTYSFNPSHRTPSTPNNYPYSYQWSNNNQGGNNVVTAKFKCSNTPKFTKAYDCQVKDLFAMTDSVIKGLVKDKPLHAEMLIKELLHELKGKTDV